MSKSKVANQLGRPKDLAKRQAILDTAQRLFLEKGYEKTSMDALAKQAGVSKLTVYNYFNDKESLFVAAIETHCENQLPALEFDLKADTAIETALLKIAHRFQGIIYSDEGLELHRLMCSATKQNPDLVRKFHQAGPARVLNHMVRLLVQAHEQKKLDAPDSQRAAEHFLSLLSGCQHMRVLFEVEPKPSSQQLQLLAQAAVQRFVVAYQY